jgi:hypothetical protein
MADVTTEGDLIKGIGGLEFDNPILTEGGRGFGERYGNWASMKDAARGKQGNVKKAAQATGKNPVMAFTTMAEDSPNFSTMPVEIAIEAFDKNLPSRRTIKDFNRRVVTDSKGKGKGFKGIDTLEGRMQLLDPNNGELRKLVMNIMTQPGFQGQGMPDIDLLRDALIEPELRGMPAGMSGSLYLRGLPGSEIYEGAPHRTYSHVIPGQFLGRGKLLPYDQLFPDVARNIAHMSRVEALGSLRQKHHWQPVTDEVLENLYGK